MNLHKKLLYQSCYRGSKENDYILCGFAKKHLNDLSEKDLELYQSLLNESDTVLYLWLTVQQSFPKKYQGTVGRLLRKYYSKNIKVQS
ncbi:MAG: succinate dehydrogenase assembly factor 2 family protein [Rickettsiales bacterium]|nr:succinate dehydrogenase assembly factor 2 family protein [Rickettsiales bacterium]|tara:strand:- start:21739 stop:22002 length:264 start_codon:yes stop_codon:yes gene_type:complete